MAEKKITIVILYYFGLNAYTRIKHDDIESYRIKFRGITTLSLRESVLIDTIISDDRNAIQIIAKDKDAYANYAI